MFDRPHLGAVRTVGKPGNKHELAGRFDINQKSLTCGCRVEPGTGNTLVELEILTLNFICQKPDVIDFQEGTELVTTKVGLRRPVQDAQFGYIIQNALQTIAASHRNQPDAAIIIGSLDNGYTLDDPNAGTISKEGLTDYLAGFKQQVESIRGNTGGPLIDLSELVTQEQAGILTAWAWWSVPGTGIQGGGLIKVGDTGVLSERLTYYTKLADS